MPKNSVGDWMIPALWASKYRLLENKPMVFFSKDTPRKHRPWAVDILNDMSQNIVVVKARQMGITEIFLCTKAVHLASLVTSTTVYTLPTDKKALEISNERMTPLGDPTSPKRYHPSIRKLMVDWLRTVQAKHITPKNGGGKSVILITGSWTQGAGESTAADACIFDEYGRMPPNIDASFRKSLSSSPLGFLWVFSTPNFPQANVDGRYMQSDQKRWFYKCSRCGNWAYLTRQNIVQRKGLPSLVQRLEAHDKTVGIPPGTFQIECLKCQRPLDRIESPGEWVASTSDYAAWSGYKMSQLDAAWITGDMIMRDLQEFEGGLREWYNYDLGEPYLGDSGGLERGWMLTLVDSTIPRFPNRRAAEATFGKLNIGIGIDWGKTSYAIVLAEGPWPYPVVLEKESFLDNPRDPQDTIRWALGLAERWGGESDFGVVADIGYGADRVPHLYNALGNKFYGCQYPGGDPTLSRRPLTSRPEFGPSPPSADSSCPVVVVDRTSSLKCLIAAIRRREYILAALPTDDIEEIDRHCRHIAIVAERNPKNGQMRETAVTLGDDHDLHALNYASIALEWSRRRKIHVGSVDAVPSPDLIEPDLGLVEIPTMSEIADIVGFGDFFDFEY